MGLTGLPRADPRQAPGARCATLASHSQALPFVICKHSYLPLISNHKNELRPLPPVRRGQTRLQGRGHGPLVAPRLGPRTNPPPASPRFCTRARGLTSCLLAPEQTSTHVPKLIFVTWPLTPEHRHPCAPGTAQLSGSEGASVPLHLQVSGPHPARPGSCSGCLLAPLIVSVICGCMTNQRRPSQPKTTPSMCCLRAAGGQEFGDTQRGGSGCRVPHRVAGERWWGRWLWPMTAPPALARWCRLWAGGPRSPPHRPAHARQAAQVSPRHGRWLLPQQRRTDSRVGGAMSFLSWPGKPHAFIWSLSTGHPGQHWSLRGGTKAWTPAEAHGRPFSPATAALQPCSCTPVLPPRVHEHLQVDTCKNLWRPQWLSERRVIKSNV